MRNCKFWTDAGLREGSILIEDGKISKIARQIRQTVSSRVDGRGLVALPGLIDAHAHLRALGLRRKEDFTTGTSAAAAGGFTTVLDMPNTVPPTDTLARLAVKMKDASTKILVNVGFHAAAVEDRQAVEEMASLGAFSLKVYLPRPISPLDVDDGTLRRLIWTASKANILLTVHAEEPTELKTTDRARTFYDMARSRPATAETHAVARIRRLREPLHAPVHFCHISIASNLRKIHSSAGSTSEVTPHHMLLSNESLKRVGWKAWMVPPLRSEAERRNLLQATVSEHADIIATDHAPHEVREKTAQPKDSPPGIPGLETTLPLLMSLINKRIMSLRTLVNCLARNPARIFGMPSKGKIEQGADADIVLVNPKKRSVVKPEKFFSKAKYSPFEGWKTLGQVDTTIVGGQVIYERGRILAAPGAGAVLKRK